MALTKTYTGADVKLYINNQLFGISPSFQITIDNGRKATYGVDQIYPFELMLTAYSVKGTAQCYRLKGDGGLEGRGLTLGQNDILFEKYITMSFVDRITDEVIFQFYNVGIINQNWKVANRSLLTGTFSFEAIFWSNEGQSQSI